MLSWKEHRFTVSCNDPFSTRRIDSFDACKDELYLYNIHFVMFQFLKAVGIREGCAPAFFSKLPAIFGQACSNMAGIGVVSASFNINKPYTCRRTLLFGCYVDVLFGPIGTLNLTRVMQFSVSVFGFCRVTVLIVYEIFLYIVVVAKFLHLCTYKNILQVQNLLCLICVLFHIQGSVYVERFTSKNKNRDTQLYILS